MTHSDPIIESLSISVRLGLLGYNSTGCEKVSVCSYCKQEYICTLATSDGM